MPTLLCSLCTYNEAENLPAIVPEIWKFAPEAHILIVDDNSPDGTGRLADEMAAQDPRVHVLHRAGKQGLGTATLAAVRYAIEHHYDYFINLDADFSHHPKYIPALLQGMETADVAIGSRYVPGGGVEGWNWRRHFMSQSINIYARLLLGLRTKDNSGSYRCYRVEKLRELDLDRFRAKGYAFQEEMLYRCRRIGCRFVEKPIYFENRRHGQSKINLKEAFSALWVMLVLWFDERLGTTVRKQST